MPCGGICHPLMNRIQTEREREREREYERIEWLNNEEQTFPPSGYVAHSREGEMSEEDIFRRKG